MYKAVGRAKVCGNFYILSKDYGALELCISEGVREYHEVKHLPEYEIVNGDLIPRLVQEFRGSSKLRRMLGTIDMHEPEVLVNERGTEIRLDYRCPELFDDDCYEDDYEWCNNTGSETVKNMFRKVFPKVPEEQISVEMGEKYWVCIGISIPSIRLGRGVNV